MSSMLVFGESGQVATALARLGQSLNTGMETMCVGRRHVDITDRRAVELAVKQYRPKIIVNAAAYTAVDKAEEEEELAFSVNDKGAMNIACAAEEYGLPVVHLSTDYVFSGDKTEPYTEIDYPDPCSVYGASKLAGEKSVARSNPRHIILRTAWVYSETGSNFVKTMLRLAEGRDSIQVVDDQKGNPTSADEIASAILSITQNIIEQPETECWGIYHFCGPETNTWAGFAKKIFKISRDLGGSFCEVIPISSAQYPTNARRPANSTLNNDKFCDRFGYLHRDMSRSLSAVVERILEK